MNSTDGSNGYVDHSTNDDSISINEHIEIEDEKIDDGNDVKSIVLGTESSFSGGNANQELDNKDSPLELIAQENRVVGIVRFVIFFVLLMAAVGTAFLVFYFAHTSEENKFEDDYEAIASFVVETMLDDMARFMWAPQVVGSAITLAISAYNASHTTIAIPPHQWADLTIGLRIATGSRYLTWSPLINNDMERMEFESFIAKIESEGFFSSEIHPPCYICGTVSQSVINPLDEVTFPGLGTYSCDFLDAAGRHGRVPAASCPSTVLAAKAVCQCGPHEAEDEALTLRHPSQGIFRFNGTDKTDNIISTITNETWNEGPYLPMLQDRLVEANHFPLLYNYMSNIVLASAVQNMLQSGRPVISEAFDLNDPTNYYAVVNQEDEEGPMSTVFLPVRSAADDSIVGTVSMLIVWSKLLMNNVPKNGNLVTVVIDNTCGQVFTYQVSAKGTNLDFIGEGDLHETKYSHKVRQSSYSDYESLVNVVTSAGSHVTYDDSCQYRFSVYPTNELEDQYLTNEPLIYAAIVIAVFVLTSLVFLFYDFVVRRRQAKILASAIRTNDIVTSLFPTSVRDRLYESNQKQADLVDSNLAMTSNKNSKFQMHSFYSNVHHASVFGSEPIADLFPYATVIFIDIANFTAWCSERDPTQVFTLLENLYHAFDVVGEKLGIFKVG
jgi:hypothetical protein